MTTGPAMLEGSKVKVELWSSFAGLLRSYVAVHGLNHVGEYDAVVEVGRDEIGLRRGPRWLLLRMDPASGDGAWQWSGGKAGGFALLESGQIRWAAEAEMEMDLVAERLASDLFRGGQDSTASDAAPRVR